MVSKHAQKRIQQRAIPPIMIDLLLEYGEFRYSRQGTGVYFLDKEGKKFVTGAMKEMGIKNIDHCLDAYLIENDIGKVVTVGHRFKRFNNN